ncbi:MAG: hypothetical protein GY916_08670 [Gammaproteobacteria bacterium]|jgi:tetratricopeptide (TPR) repeat protein|nr:hypothetical protein [Gammaproteobacteria bacterium]
MINDHALSDDLLNKVVSLSPDVGRPDDHITTIGTALTEAAQHIAAGDLPKGEHLLLQLHLAAPESVYIMMLIAGLYIECGLHRNALAQLDKVLAIDVLYSPALIRKAHVLHKLNRAREAVTIATTIKNIEADNPDNLNNLGVYLMAIGDFSAAAEAYSAAISLRPNFLAAYHNLTCIPQQTLDNFQLAHLERLSDDNRLQDNDRALALLCISEHHRSKTQRRREFQYLNRANFILSEQSPWDVTGFTQVVDGITALKPAMLESFRQPRQTSITPVFISSMPRAGSTLLEQLVATHPDITSIGEAGLATTAIKATAAEHQLLELPWWQWFEHPQATELSATVRLAFDRAIAGLAPTTGFICEKSINNDILLGLNLLAFPDSYVIHCRRDPLDICLSAYQTYLPQLDYTNNLQWLATRYRQHVQLMEHWHGLFPDRIVEVRYEDLVSRTDAEISRILNAIGLVQPPGGMNIDDRNYTVNSASNWQIRQPIYQSSRRRWRQYSEQLQEIMHLEDHPTT